MRVARPSPRDSTVILHADYEESALTVRKADRSLHKFAVGKGLSPFSFELDGQAFAGLDDLSEALWSHDRPPYGSESSRTSIGCVTAFTDR